MICKQFFLILLKIFVFWYLCTYLCSKPTFKFQLLMSYPIQNYTTKLILKLSKWAWLNDYCHIPSIKMSETRISLIKSFSTHERHELKIIIDQIKIMKQSKAWIHSTRSLQNSIKQTHWLQGDKNYSKNHGWWNHAQQNIDYNLNLNPTVRRLFPNILNQ